MVTFDKLPIRDVLVDRLGWSEEDARAFLDVLTMPIEDLATKEDVDRVRADVEALRVEVRASVQELRDELHNSHQELRSEFQGAHQELRSEFQELRGELYSAHQELRSEFQELRGELHSAHQELRSEFQELRGELHSAHQELRPEFQTSLLAQREEVRSQLSALEKRILQYVEGRFDELATRLDERDRRIQAEQETALRSLERRIYLFGFALFSAGMGVGIAILVRL